MKDTRTATILGAGYMGSAMAFPLAARGLDVRLWGTWLDDDLIEASRRGPHPRLRLEFPDSVELYKSAGLEAAVDGTDMLFVGVASEGFVPVFQRLLGVLDDTVPIFTLTKGFSILERHVYRTSVAAEALFELRFGERELVWTSIGGPVKAYELARGVPSPAVYASESETASTLVDSIRTNTYRINTTQDVVGVELCSALKNVYAAALGLCDGLYKRDMPENYHNFSSLLFTQAIREMALVVVREGGLARTVHDLAGIGDLYVTAQSGKNQRFGLLVGQGMSPEEAYHHMLNEGELAEGYLALETGRKWLEATHPSLLDDLPLFATLHDVAYAGAAAETALQEMVTSRL
jgi:glycerol-3-phosphate dehydrogenase (NAD(P)+)